MKIKFAILPLFLSLVANSYAINPYKAALAKKAISADAEISGAAINELRSMKQEGLSALLAEFEKEIGDFKINGKKSERLIKISNAIDAVAMQKDAYASELFWQIDLAQAKIEAKKQNKPILSLRLLGNLNEEFSCANSRFFRAILYSNSDISKYLRENYILHWKSVRPAPKITIEFGDGRKIERTITGNSIHYILDKNGSVIDALPGLYSPQAFINYLKLANEQNAKIEGKSKEDREIALSIYRQMRFNEIKAKRDSAIAASKVVLTGPDSGTRAIEAAPRAITKKSTEINILLALEDKFSGFTPKMTIDDWQKLASRYAREAALDESSKAFIRRQNPDLSKEEFSRLIANTERYLSLDTTQNDFVFHMQIYGWIDKQEITDLERFNAGIYDKIFRTPDSDKWLGLYQNDIYTALDGNGVIK